MATDLLGKGAMIRRQNIPGQPPPEAPPPPPEAKVQAGLAAYMKLSEDTPKDARQRKTKPYYSAEYAQHAKAILDKLHTGGKPIRVNCQGISVITASLQYYQGAAYLRDHDESGKYDALFLASKCSREEQYNYIEFKIRARKKCVIADIQISAPWREELLHFIDTAEEKQKYHRDDVSLTDEDIAWFNNLLIPLEKLFIFRASHNDILVVRHTET
jgi:hypothetical protein